MGFFYLLFASAFSYILIWSFNLSNSYVARAINQVKVDAVSLSLCHSRRNFMNSIWKWNTPLNFIQSGMNVVAPICDAVEAFGIVCPGRPGLIIAGKIGKALQVFQDGARYSYQPLAYLKRQKLLEKNNMAIEDVDAVATVSSIDDGIEREELSIIQKYWEIRYTTSWPSPLIASDDFKTKNRYHLIYHPPVPLLGGDQKNFIARAAQDNQPLKMRATKVPQEYNSKFKTESACLLNDSPPFYVEREQ